MDEDGNQYTLDHCVDLSMVVPWHLDVKLQSRFTSMMDMAQKILKHFHIWTFATELRNAGRHLRFILSPS